MFFCYLRRLCFVSSSSIGSNRCISCRILIVAASVSRCNLSIGNLWRVIGCTGRVAGREQQVCLSATWFEVATSMPYSDVSGLQVTSELQVAFKQVCSSTACSPLKDRSVNPRGVSVVQGCGPVVGLRFLFSGDCRQPGSKGKIFISLGSLGDV